MSKIKHKTNKSKRIARSCRNNGSCSYCRNNRLHHNHKRLVETSLRMQAE